MLLERGKRTGNESAAAQSLEVNLVVAAVVVFLRGDVMLGEARGKTGTERGH
jgi:hypothetical protein